MYLGCGSAGRNALAQRYDTCILACVPFHLFDHVELHTATVKFHQHFIKKWSKSKSMLSGDIEINEYRPKSQDITKKLPVKLV
jgi:hypothetical protein